MGKLENRADYIPVFQRIWIFILPFLLTLSSRSDSFFYPTCLAAQSINMSRTPQFCCCLIYLTSILHFHFYRSLLLRLLVTLFINTNDHIVCQFSNNSATSDRVVNGIPIKYWLNTHLIVLKISVFFTRLIEYKDNM